MATLKYLPLSGHFHFPIGFLEAYSMHVTPYVYLFIKTGIHLDPRIFTAFQTKINPVRKRVLVSHLFYQKMIYLTFENNLFAGISLTTLDISPPSCDAPTITVSLLIVLGAHYTPF